MGRGLNRTNRLERWVQRAIDGQEQHLGALMHDIVGGMITQVVHERDNEVSWQFERGKFATLEPCLFATIERHRGFGMDIDPLERTWTVSIAGVAWRLRPWDWRYPMLNGAIWSEAYLRDRTAAENLALAVMARRLEHRGGVLVLPMPYVSRSVPQSV